MHGALYTYERWWLQVSVKGHTEEIIMGLAEALLCPMLLGVDWPHLKEAVAWVLRRNGGEWQNDPETVCFGAPKNEDRGDLDMEQIIGNGYFYEEQKQDPLFHNIWQTQAGR